jgi:hypothetical protein
MALASSALPAGAIAGIVVGVVVLVVAVVLAGGVCVVMHRRKKETAVSDGRTGMVVVVRAH